MRSARIMFQGRTDVQFLQRIQTTHVSAPERFLVKEVNWLGDVVMNLKALRAVRKSFPNARVSQ